MDFAINHMAVPRLGVSATIKLAQKLGCVGVEFRNDLNKPLFDGDAPEDVADIAKQSSQRILALAEVKAFNDVSGNTLDSAIALIKLAGRCHAEAVSLIPRNDGRGTGNGERQGNLRRALSEIKPHLEAAGMLGYVEPLGFEQSSLRFKGEALDAISAVNGEQCFRLIHDTFHHNLAGDTECFPAMTSIVHVSGVVDPALALRDMRDEHRVLVDERDRLGNLDQLAALFGAGYAGPVSFEPFSPVVHALDNPSNAFERSMEYIRSGTRGIAE